MSDGGPDARKTIAATAERWDGENVEYFVWWIGISILTCGVFAFVTLLTGHTPWAHKQLGDDGIDAEIRNQKRHGRL